MLKTSCTVLQNYNKSRIHSARGARLVKMTVDQQVIFYGEMSRGDNSEVRIMFMYTLLSLLITVGNFSNFNDLGQIR